MKLVILVEEEEEKTSRVAGIHQTAELGGDNEITIEKFFNICFK
jgi:hypothetical protein